MNRQSKNGISWTDATWNPFVGCSKISEGCTNCWAERAARLHYKSEFPDGWDGHVKFFPERLDWPLRLRKPRKIAVGLMGDLFNEEIPLWFIDKVFEVIEKCPQHIFQILSKRPRIARLDIKAIYGSLPNVWLGVSVENQKTADERIPILLQIPAAVRFVSCEPLLGPIDFDSESLSKLNWLIVGSESGPGARPMQIEWVRSIMQQCKSVGVPVHIKQLHINGKTSKNPDEWPADLRIREFPGI